MKMTTASPQTVWYLDLKEVKIESNTNNNYEYQQNVYNHNNYTNENVRGNFLKTIDNMNEVIHEPLPHIFVHATPTNANTECNLDQRNIASPNCDIVIYDLSENINENKRVGQQETLQEKPKPVQNQQKQQNNFNGKYSNGKINGTKNVYSYNEQHDKDQQHYICYHHTSQTVHLPENCHEQGQGPLPKIGDFWPVNNRGYRYNDKYNGAGDEDDDDKDNNSLASMETPSDNISIWIDGEKHWISGVDAHTTCSDLICALVNYENIQKDSYQQHQQQSNQCSSKIVAEDQMSLINERDEYIIETSTERDCTQKKKLSRKQEQSKPIIKAISKKKFLCVDGKTAGNKTEQMNSNSKSNTNNDYGNKRFEPHNACDNINQSVPTNTKENCKATTRQCNTGGARISLDIRMSNVIVSPPDITAAQLATEYVIVKQYRHCEEYLDGSTKVIDLVPQDDQRMNNKEYELLLRRLAPPPSHIHIGSYNATPQFSSLISTDKDSGMGSPVGSTRNAKCRRRKHKSSQWLAQANTLHPKLSRNLANERLMKIILAQDETIQKQLYLLKEKEEQIVKIEAEKHRKRLRELGKNYLLETYLNGLEEATYPPIEENQNNTVDKVFIGELHQNCINDPTTNTLTTPVVHINNNCAQDSLNYNDIIYDRRYIKSENKKKTRDKNKHNDDNKCQKGDTNCNYNKNKKLLNYVEDNCIIIQNETNRGENLKNDKGQEQLVEMQIFWLEKVYNVNKQLQKEEEIAAKLYAKIRKYQLKRVYQTHQDMQQEIDILDNTLALQCSDIRKVEAHLWASNELFQKKLTQLERLSQEYIHNAEIENEKNAEIYESQNNSSLSETVKVTVNSNKNVNNLRMLDVKETNSQKLTLKASLEKLADEDKEEHSNVLITMREQNSMLVNEDIYTLQITKGNLTQFPLQYVQQEQSIQYQLQEQQQQKQQHSPHNYLIRHINQSDMTTDTYNSYINCNSNNHSNNNNNNNNNKHRYSYNKNDNNYKQMPTIITVEKHHNNPVAISSTANSFTTTMKPKIVITTTTAAATVTSLKTTNVIQKQQPLHSSEIINDNTRSELVKQKQKTKSPAIIKTITTETSVLPSLIESPSSAFPLHSLLIDKNMLASSHVQNSKTIQKQMFSNTQSQLQAQIQCYTLEVEPNKAMFNNSLPKLHQKQQQLQKQVQSPSSSSLPAVFTSIPETVTTITSTAIKNTTSIVNPSTQLVSSSIIQPQQQQPQINLQTKVAVVQKQSLMGMHGNTFDISQLGTLV